MTIEERLRRLENKVFPNLKNRKKDFLRKAGGNYPRAICLAEQENDTQVIKSLQREMDNLE